MIGAVAEFRCGEEQVTTWSFGSKAQCDVYFATHPELHFHALRHPDDDPALFPACAVFCAPKSHSYESMPAIDTP